MEELENKPFIKGVYACRNLHELINYISIISLRRSAVQFGVKKEPGVSMARARKEANAKAIELLNTLSDSDGTELTQEQRQTLAAYTGEGGIGGSDSEYYTPQPIAEGIWEVMKLYGADTGNTLEPSAGVGVFHETKPAGTIMTATEIDSTSGRINQLLHPEDSVKISPFEVLAAGSQDGSFDHCVGNVPFGDARGTTANLDPAYKEETNMGRYFVLRLLDKIKAGGYACIIVPNGVTSGSTMKKLREQISRKAEFLGAHRLPTGTFDENGTSTVVDVLILRKHPAELADMILQADEDLLTQANVLWPEFINGKWFEQDGKRFIYGEQSQAFRGITVKNDQVTNADLKQKLIHKFDSRINWDMLNIEQPLNQKVKTGEKRFINGQWYLFDGASWVIDNTVQEMALDASQYGASSHEDLDRLISTHEGILTLSFAQISAIRADYPYKLNNDMHEALKWVDTQKAPLRERLWRGTIIGQKVAQFRARMDSMQPESREQNRIDTANLVRAELKQWGNPNQGRIAKVSGSGSGSWMAFRGAIRNDSELTDMLSGKLDTSGGVEYDAHDHAATVRHLFNNIDLVPIELSDFRGAFAGDLPSDDDELLDLLSDIDGIAVTPDGNLVPFDRATSGDIGVINTQLQAAVAVLPDGRQKSNMLRQLMAIKEKRTWTDGEDINVKLNARWFDRSLLLEFLHENGYSEFKYVKDVQIENGQLTSGNYNGPDGLFVGYQYRTVVGKNKETKQIEPRWDKASAKNGEEFHAQLEKFLNGGKPAGVNAEQYKRRIMDMEEQFNDWLKSRDDYDSAIVGHYNDVFNDHIPYTQSDADLQLKTISGARVPLDYQAQEVRRVSEAGRGIVGFGTGLGKTTTGLALEAYNFENGRTKRTAFVVPKAVYQNWYYEAKEFYSSDAFANMLFVGLEPITDGNGAIKQVPVLDENGKPVVGKDGQPVTRDALKMADEATIKARMGSIPQSNWRTVVMTKEQYAKIPLKEETIRDHAFDVMFAEVDAGRVAANTKNHQEETKKQRVLAKASDDGTAKEYDYPFFEEMNFDSVIADEGHNYRNSYSAGREAGALAYLPNPAVAQSARDFSLKNSYLMKKNNGRGPVLLTATPLVNSPIDAYNMLSHVMSQDEWRKMGILTPDDFVRMFGRIEPVLVQKVSGKLVKKDGLVGFENLGALRAMFHKHTTLKTAKDVSSTVKIPDLDEHTQFAPMTEEQSETYEQLRQRADLLGKDPSQLTNEEIEKLESGEIPEDDSVFAIIRDMDRVCTDMDLYHHTVTFRFKPSQKDAVQSLADKLPSAKVFDDDDFITLVVPEDDEDRVIKALAEFDLAEKDISHPIPPKYSKLIDLVREGMKDGKQIIFTDEKSQHGKLRRILADALNVDLKQIGILNADSVADASKKPKIKAVKPPKELPDDPTEEQMQTYYAQKSAYDAYVGQLEDVSLGGLEKIAADFNEGRTPIIICNKKAEVGINLHKGTADIHHLTLPWTPASIDQRNGRGARVGSTQDRVRVHYYCGKGSFDQFRLDTLKRKKSWITDIVTSDKSKMDNADANDAAEMQLLLAANPEERAKKLREQEEEIKAKALAAAQKRAGIDLQNYIKASHALTTDPEKVETSLDRAKSEVERYQRLVDRDLEEQRQAKQTYDDPASLDFAKSMAETTLKRTMKNIKENQDELAEAQKKVRFHGGVLKRISAAASKIKQLRPVIQKALDSGVLAVDPDVLNNAKNMLLVDGRAYKVGQYYKADVFKSRDGYRSTTNSNAIVCIESMDFDTQNAIVSNVSSFNADNQERRSGVPLKTLVEQVYLSESERDLLRKMSGGISIVDVPMLGIGKAEFRRYLQDQQLFLKDAYIVLHDSAGLEVDIVGSNASAAAKADHSKKNAAKIVFPDTTDRTLQNDVANFYRAAGRTEQGLMRMFMSALFGSDYTTAIESYGETASPETIAELVTNWSSNYQLDSYTAKNNTMTGDSEKEVKAYIANGKLPYGAMESMRIDSLSAPQYSNQKEIRTAAENEILRLKTLALANCQRAVKQLGQAYYEKAKAAITAGIPEKQGFMQNYLETARGSLSFEYKDSSQFSYFPDVVPLVTDLVLAGLYNESQITPEMLVNMDEINQLFEDMTRKITELSDSDRKSMLDAYNLKIGAVTQEELDQRQQVVLDEAKSTEEAAGSQQALGLIVKTNASQLTITFKKRMMGRFEPGKAWALQDPEGKSGRLMKSKDELKEKFSAKFYMGASSLDEFPGAWWVISKDNDINDILAVIEKY